MFSAQGGESVDVGGGSAFAGSRLGLQDRTALELASGASRVTLLGRWLEPHAGELLDLTFGYPAGLDPEWARQRLTSVTLEQLDRSSTAALEAEALRYFRTHLNWDHLTLTHSASEALHLAFDAALEAPNDEVLLYQWGFDAYEGLIGSCRGKAVYAAREPGQRPRIEDLERRLTARSRALLITQPENPLGTIYSREELSALVDLALAHDLTLIVDHAFSEVSPFGLEVPLLTRIQRDLEAAGLRFMMIADTGKLLSLHGLKLGVVAASHHFQSVLEQKRSSRFFQLDTLRLAVLASVLSDPRFPEHKRALNQHLAANYTLLKDSLDARIQVQPLAATAMVLLDISALKLTDQEFAARLLEAERVALIPGSFFFQAREGAEAKARWVRAALSRPRSVLQGSVDRINRFVAGLG